MKLAIARRLTVLLLPLMSYALPAFCQVGDLLFRDGFEPTAKITISPTPAFAPQLVDTASVPLAVTITNVGGITLAISEIGNGGVNASDFVLDLSATQFTLAPTASTTLNITFTPAGPWQPGTREAQLELLGNVPGGVAYAAESGQGATCGGALPACSSGCADSDGDGLNDAWEIAGGIDLNNDGVIDAENDLLLPGADPHKPDVYLHYDYTYASDHNHNPPAQAIQWIVDAFAAHGIDVHIDPQHNAICENAGDAGCITVGTGAQVVTLGEPGSGVTDPVCAGPSAVSVRELRTGIPYLNLIKPAYHYMVFAHYASTPTGGGPYVCPTDPENPACGEIVSQPPVPGNLGTSEIGGNDALVATQPFVDSGTVPIVTSIPTEWWSGLGMHELGHNLGLLHGGADCFNNKPNYVGVMNYRFYIGGISTSASPGGAVPQSCVTDADCNAGDHAVSAHCSTFAHTCFRIDYSDREFNALDEGGGAGGLDETIGLQGGTNNTDISWWHSVTPTPFVRIPTNGSPIDWNKNGIFTDTGVVQEVNGDGELTLLNGQNDWEVTSIGGINHFNRLQFRFQCDPNFGN